MPSLNKVMLIGHLGKTDGPFGWSILVWGVIVAILGSALLIGQLWYKIWKLENPKVEVEIYPNRPTSKNITLVIHNKSEVTANFSAVMTCTVDPEYPGAILLVTGLQNVSMCWESSGTANEFINRDGKKLLKLCSKQEGNTGEEVLHYTEFYKIESGQIKTVECAHWTETSRVPKINIDIQLDSDREIKGRNLWQFQIYYMEVTKSIAIYEIAQSKRGRNYTVNQSTKGGI